MQIIRYDKTFLRNIFWLQISLRLSANGKSKSKKSAALKIEISRCLKWHPVWHLLVQSSNRNKRTICQICSKSTIKTPEQRHHFNVATKGFLIFFRGYWKRWRRYSVFIFDFEQILHVVLVYALMILNK